MSMSHNYVTGLHGALIICVLGHGCHFIFYDSRLTQSGPFTFPSFFMNPIIVLSAFKDFFSNAPPCVFRLMLISPPSLASPFMTMSLLSHSLLSLLPVHISILFSLSQSEQGGCGCLLLWFEPTATSAFRVLYLKKKKNV